MERIRPARRCRQPLDDRLMSHKVSTEGFREAARTALFALVSRCFLRKRKEPVGVEPVSAIVEPVSGSPKRKLEKPEQRLARQPRQLGALSASFPGQSLWRICLSLGNIVSSRKPGNYGAETALAGWGARIRTWEWRNQNPPILPMIQGSF